MQKLALATSLAFFFAASTQGTATERKYMTPPKTDARPQAPFSTGVLVGDTLYVAGHIGLDAATGQAAADVENEARLVMDAVKQTVEQAGLAMDDLVSVTVYCTDLDLYDKFNGVYRTYFRAQYPARAFIGINKLVRGARFEVAGIAVKPARVRKP